MAFNGEKSIATCN